VRDLSLALHQNALMPSINTHPPESSGLQAWFATPLGLQWMQHFQAACVSELARVYGHTGLFLRPCEQMPPALNGHMLAQVHGLYRVNQHFEGDFQCSDTQLPISDESLSLMYALCVMETSAQPEALFQELARCIKPEGTLLLISLNALSAGRLRWAGQGLMPVSAGVLSRWCLENDLDIVKQCLIVPVYGNGQKKTPPREPRLGLLTPFYAGRLLVAKRRIAGVTPLRKNKQLYQLNPRVSLG
jgi:SAM-dependent methyltransferase